MIEAVKRSENCFVLSKLLLCDIWTPDDRPLPHLLLKWTLTFVWSKDSITNARRRCSTPGYTLKETLESPAIKYPIYLSLKVNTYAVSHTP